MRRYNSFPRAKTVESNERVAEERNHLLHEIEDLQNENRMNLEAAQALLAKDLSRSIRLAEAGINETERPNRPLVPKANCCERFGRSLITTYNRLKTYFKSLSQKEEEVEEQAFRGPLLFCKWMFRFFFITIIATSFLVAFEEIGCAVKTHDKCNDDTLDLLEGDTKSVLGAFLGILGAGLGELLGKIIWNKLQTRVDKTAKFIANLCEKSKFCLFVTLQTISLVISAAVGAGCYYLADEFFKEEGKTPAYIGMGVGLGISVIFNLMATAKNYGYNFINCMKFIFCCKKKNERNDSSSSLDSIIILEDMNSTREERQRANLTANVINAACLPNNQEDNDKRAVFTLGSSSGNEEKSPTQGPQTSGESEFSQSRWQDYVDKSKYSNLTQLT